MRRWLKIILALVVVVVIAATVFLVPTIWFKPWSINHFYSRVLLEFALESPMLLSQIRILEPMGLDFHSDDLDDASVEAQQKFFERARRNLGILHSYDASSMTPAERISYDTMEMFLEAAIEGERFRFHGYPLNQMSGQQSRLPDFMINTHQINRRKDAENYIVRVSKFGVYYDQVLAGLKLREEKGIIPPRFVIRRVLDEMNGFVEKPPKENALYVHFQEKLVELEDTDEEQSAEMLARLEEEIESTVYPAYNRLIEYYTYLEPVATTDDGVWKLPDGEDFYAFSLSLMTTTDLSADEIHQIGLQEVDRIQAEMRAILRSEGLPANDLAAAMNRLNKDPRFLYPATDESREQILADYQSILDEIDKGLEPFFDVRPAVGVAVKRVPEFREEGSAGAYYNPPPLDRSKPGTFFVNLRDVAETPKFRMRTLAYHEGIPGHHFQIAIAQEAAGLPLFRRMIPLPAFSEGWALYAEQVAAENGFQEDPYDRLGYLRDQVFRAVRLVVDTGIHSKRWTREQAIEYLVENTGSPESEAVTEIERYIVMPGQACAYMVGRLKILELRARAQERLGEGFDLREFHNVLLTNGALPLTMLDRVVENWLGSKAAAAPGA